MSRQLRLYTFDSCSGVIGQRDSEGNRGGGGALKLTEAYENQRILSQNGLSGGGVGEGDYTLTCSHSLVTSDRQGSADFRELNGGFRITIKAARGETSTSSCAASGSSEIIHGKRVPSRANFAKVITMLLSNKATLCKGVEGVGKRHKLRKMIYCLAEGYRIIGRNFIKTAVTISLHQVAWTKCASPMTASAIKATMKSGGRSNPNVANQFRTITRTYT